MALSVSVAGPRPLAGTLPCGDRTFLPRQRSRSDCPSGSFYDDCLTFDGIVCTGTHVHRLTKSMKWFELPVFSGVSYYQVARWTLHS